MICKFHIKGIKMFRIFAFAFIFVNLLYAQEKVSLQLSWKNQFQFAGYYMAKEKGFYSDANLNVNIKEFSSGINASDDVVEGKTDFGVGRSSLISDRYEGKPITILAAIFQHSPVMLLTKKRDDITKIEDLKDKTIMLSGDLTASAPINAMLQSKKVTQDMFTIQTHSFDVQDLIDGKTDAMLSYVSNEPYALKKQNIPYTIFSPRDYNFDFYSDILFTSNKLVKEKPQIVQAFREASLKGWRYALANKEETVNLILEKYNTQKRTKEALLFEAQEVEKLVDENTIELGDIDSKRIEYISQIYALMGFINKKEEVTDFIYKVKKSSQTKILNLTDKEKEFIKTNPKIILGADQNWKPFDWKDKSGNHAGFDADFTQLLSKKLNIEIEVKLGDWDALQNDVKNKKIEGIIGASKNEKRDKYMLFTKPYFMFTQVILIGKDNKSISFISDLDGKTIALKEGSSLDINYFKKNYPNIKQKLYNTDTEIITALSEKKVDAALSNIGSASYEMERNFISNVKVAFNIDELAGDMRYGIRNDKPELVSILQKGIDLITEEEIDIMLGKWVKLAVSNHDISKLNLTKKEKEWLKKDIPIRYVYDPDWAPFEWKNELGHHTGIVADIINIVAERSGITFEALETKSWAMSKQKVQNRDADMYSAINESEEILKYMDFTTRNLFDIPFAFVTRADDKSDYFNVFDALEGKTIAVVEGYPIEDMIRDERPDIELITVKNMTEGFEKLRNGEIDVFCEDIVTAKRFINVEGFDDLRIAVKTGYSFDLKIALRDDWSKEAISIINKALDTITKKEIDDIYNQWTNITYKEKIDYSLIWKILAGVLVVILLFIYYNRKLKILVNEKTNELQEVLKSLEVKVEMRTAELNNQKEFVQTLLDSQEQIVITTNGDSIISVNKAFLKFYNIASIKEFSTQYNVTCICDTFHTDAPNGYLQKVMEDENWIDYVIKRVNLDMTHKVQIIREDIKYVFSVTAAVLPGDDGLKSAVFTNITEIERAKQEVESIHKHTRESIEYASLIQGALIPENQIFEHFFQDYFAIWSPKDIVGGDIYLMNEINEDELIIMVIDCTGHGVPGAFVTMLVKAIERQLMANIHRDKMISPAKILGIFNRSIKNLLKQESVDSVSNAGFDGGIIYYNKKEKIVKFSGAETYLFYIDEKREFQTIKGSRHSIGYKKSDANFEFKEHTITVEDRMQFYCSTDGYLDQNGGEKGFPFGKRKFSQLIMNNQDENFSKQKEVLIEMITKYQGNEIRNDDVTVIGFKV